jgi:hypothetical protein
VNSLKYAGERLQRLPGALRQILNSGLQIIENKTLQISWGVIREEEDLEC